MRTLSTFAISSLIVLGLASSVKAAPVDLDFTAPGFGPLSGTVGVFNKPGINLLGFGLLDLEVDALNALMAPSRLLHWDADDGLGHRDGFGVRRLPGVAESEASYTNDEIEGDEVLALRFSTPLNLLSFNVTDLFFERENAPFGAGPLPDCTVGNTEGCYLERGQYSVDGGATWTFFHALATQLRGSSNGELTVDVNLHNVSTLLLRAPGRTFATANTPFMLEDFSLAGIRVDRELDTCQQGCAPVPEPASLLLMGTGLMGVVRVIRRRKAEVKAAAAQTL